MGLRRVELAIRTARATGGRQDWNEQDMGDMATVAAPPVLDAVTYRSGVANAAREGETETYVRQLVSAEMTSGRRI
jgi:hypothetical protein